MKTRDKKKKFLEKKVKRLAFMNRLPIRKQHTRKQFMNRLDKTPIRKQFINAFPKPLIRKPFINMNKFRKSPPIYKPFMNKYNNNPKPPIRKPFINVNTFPKPSTNAYNNNPKINYDFMYISDKIQPINENNNNANVNENILNNNNEQLKILTNTDNNEDKNENILNNNNEQPKILTNTDNNEDKNEKLARIFSNPVLNEPQYIAKMKEIDDLEKEINELVRKRNVVGTSTSSEWQRLDKKIYKLYDEKQNLIKESHLIADNLRNKDGRRKTKKKSRSKKRKSKRYSKKK